jgi:hypothetical protein
MKFDNLLLWRLISESERPRDGCEKSDISRNLQRCHGFEFGVEVHIVHTIYKRKSLPGVPIWFGSNETAQLLRNAQTCNRLSRSNLCLIQSWHMYARCDALSLRLIPSTPRFSRKGFLFAQLGQGGCMPSRLNTTPFPSLFAADLLPMSVH